ncbi:methyltransferase [Asanoa ishikariensis]|uniref:Methyltransferase domain-containing protein n=1 Tax=Asanoa ishikariensis TaxID=137265 RepID=A0A1H3MMJ6_9ACTN|nr:class I SAM-dependent methyltransferase [Asanoa ishikariensis]GIF66216.1 methyltransferase [Asanoa ishikariensis]SDY77648.1 Methyltransferase domain-containing protein [Asanoa ishikariensis]
MSPYLDASAWQESWDRQQEAFLPDREERFTAMLDIVEAVAGPAPRVLDLAGGTGSISLRTLRRFPRGTTTLVDVDPVLLTIARASLDDRTAIVTTDLRSPSWTADLPHDGYDAVLSATALHWLDQDRLAALYGEVAHLIRPGGVLINADHMPDEGLPVLSSTLRDRARGRRNARYAAGAAMSWPGWWELVSRDEILAAPYTERKKIFSSSEHNDWTPPATWHEAALRKAGFQEVGLAWRGGTDAAVVGVR